MKILLAVDPFGNSHKALEKTDLIVVGHRERNRLDLFVLGRASADAHFSVLVVW